MKRLIGIISSWHLESTWLSVCKQILQTDIKVLKKKHLRTSMLQQIPASRSQVLLMAWTESAVHGIVRLFLCIARASAARIDSALSLCSVLKDPCRSMLIHRTPDSSCLLYWSRRINTSWTEELLPLTQFGNRFVELIIWDDRAWRCCSSSWQENLEYTLSICRAVKKKSRL